MSEEVASRIISFLSRTAIKTLDLTGGAPEINPVFRTLVKQASSLGVEIIDRCNLTVLEEKGQEDLVDFLKAHKVRIIASMPCYLGENVDQQRGKGVYEKSISALKRLNSAGYGVDNTGLILDLVYNPQGPVLPPSQIKLEQDYKKALANSHDIRFNKLLTLTNMPIQRFGSMLVSKGQFDGYMDLLRNAYRQENLDTVMCKTLISVDWQGYIYDCDFNQMLGLHISDSNGSHINIASLDEDSLRDKPIQVADHCYGCTAGQGSSCGGALS